MKRYLFKSMLTLGAATLMVSCSDDVILDGEGNVPGGYSDKVCFVVSNVNATRGGSPMSRRCGGVFLQSEGGTDSLYMALTVDDAPPATRAAYLTEENYRSLRMTCRKRMEGNRYEYYFDNTKFTKTAEGVWESEGTYWWLNEDTHFSFYGYAPADAPGVTFVKDEQTWEPKLDYTVPADVSRQSDLVYNTLNQEYIASANEVVPLSLTHALANVAFKTGTGMAAGTIESVTLNNVAGHGTLNLTTGQWTIDPASTTNFTVDLKSKPSADGQALNTNADATYFMLLPGSITEETSVQIAFKKADSPADEPAQIYTAPLTGNWEAGKQYSYTITISPDLNITVDSDTQDAHYVICHGQVKDVHNMQPGQEWELTATASDGAHVTLLSKLNSYQQAGFWTDKVYVQGVNDNTPHETQESARGESSLTGTGDSDFYIFLPENIGVADRKVTLTIKVKGASQSVATYEIKQLCPDWSGGSFGWEQLENNPQCDWGFLWDRVVTYEKANIWLNALVYYPLIQDLVTQNNAENYTVVKHNGSSWRPVGTGGKTSIEIDYRKLNNLTSLGLNSSDGLGNTRKLYSFAGGATTGKLEQAIQDLAQQGSTGVFNIIQEEGTNNTTTAVALGYILLKNRYNLVRISKEQNGTVVTTETPALNTDEGIVWYMPAADQFNQGPVQHPLDESVCDYWSSTPVGNSSRIYTSSGQAERTYNRKIRACRQRP